jgi:hypothetical protein
MRRQVFDSRCQIYVVDNNDDIIETLAELDGFGPAKAAFEAFLQTRTYSRIQFREKSRIVETAETGGYDSTTKQVAILRRET